jgi:hypothetical protein
VDAFDLDLVWFFGIRAVFVFVVWQTIWFGARFRHEIRRVGWSPRGIGLLTAAMWTLVLAELAGFLLYLTGAYLATYVLFVVLLFGYDRIIAAIDAQTNPRILLVQEVSRIFAELGRIEGVDTRARIDEDLAALDRWVTPETFEFIQLARSRVLAWFDGGPRGGGREERWAKRMDEIVALWRPATGPDRWRRLVNPVRSWVLGQAAWLATVSGGALGASVFFGRSPFLALPMILLGWLATWGTRRVVWLALVGSAGGLAVGALYVVVDGRKLLLGPWLATVAAIAVVVLLIAWKGARSAAASPRTGLRLLTQPQSDRRPDGEPRSIGPAP